MDEIRNNNIGLLETSAGFGGEFFVTGEAIVECNKIVSEGDRYLDIDPDPHAEPRPTVRNNWITVIIKQGVRSNRGTLLELRAQDFDCDPNVDSNGCPPGMYQVFGSPANDSRIVDVPLMGFSLVVIAMEDDDEFNVRIRTRLRDPEDEQPEPPEPPLEGSITREEGLMPMGSANGVMDMQTLTAGSVAAKGVFARAGAEKVVVAFEYLFVDNPEAELIVYLSDDPEVSENLVQLARIRPPAHGPGSIGSGKWALFYGMFPKEWLNFTRGTYVELELRGAGSRVWIDNFDPQINCEGYQCADFAEPPGLDDRDFLVLLAECGRSFDPFGADSQKWCLDSRVSWDQYIDLSDIFPWDTFLNGTGLNACGPGFGDGWRGHSTTGNGIPVTLPSTDTLVIAGKPSEVGVQRDYLYTFAANGTCLGDDPLNPASEPHADRGFRSNGRLVKDGSGRVCQIHGTQGLIRLDTAQVVIPPTSLADEDHTVYIGVTPTGDGNFAGVPMLDVAFHPADDNIAYVVPVLVVPDEYYTNPDQQICPYKSAAKLALQEQPDGSYIVSLEQLYGIDPAEDACVTVDEFLDCEFISWNPDIHRMREIEIDASGKNLFVLSAQALHENNDWLLVFDEATATELRISAGGTFPQPTSTSCPDATGDGVELPEAPTAMLFSECDGNKLYMTSSTNGLDPYDVHSEISVFNVNYNGNGSVTGVMLDDVIDINYNDTTTNGLGLGHMAIITAIEQHPVDCRLYVTGFTAPKVDPELSYNASPSSSWGQLFDPGASIFTTPTLAIVPIGQSSATARRIACHELALPLSAVFSGSGECEVSGDFNTNGNVDLCDFAAFQGCFNGEVGLANNMCRNTFDADCDGDVDLGDLKALEAMLTGPTADRNKP